MVPTRADHGTGEDPGTRQDTTLSKRGDTDIMPGDYPDYTELFQLIGTDIIMPVDIQAQYVALDIRIKSQEVTINIDIDAQSVGVYLQADWAAKEGNAVQVRDIGLNKATSLGIDLSHPVNAGKTFFINGFSGASYAFAPADRDKNQMCWGTLLVDEEYKIDVGGNGGFSIALATPIVVPGGSIVTAHIRNWANHDCTVSGTIIGYEI